MQGHTHSTQTLPNPQPPQEPIDGCVFRELRLCGCDLVDLYLKQSPLSQQIQNISFSALQNTLNSVYLHGLNEAQDLQNLGRTY